MLDFNKLRGLNIVYIKLYENRVVIRDVNSKATIDRKSNVPFSNSRLLLADISYAELFLRELLDELSEKRVFKKALAILFQPIEKTEGGLSQVEKMSYNDLGIHIGGKYVVIEEGDFNIDDDSVKHYFR